MRTVTTVVFIFLFATQQQIAACSGETSAVADTASHVGDTLTVSLLTCKPGTAIYQLYGHTSIRVRVTTTGKDWAFNYGMFDFNTPNFVMRFLLGQTDYMLGVYPYADFAEEYSERGSDIVEQELNLTPNEKNRLFTALAVNALPENCTYRYNFLYENCTSQARGMIERCVNGEISYPTDNRKESYRQIVHIYTKDSPWSEFGQDLLLGAAADEEITQRQKMFAPFYLEEYAEKATIISPDGMKRPLVKRTTIIKARNQIKRAGGFPVTPAALFGTFVAITAIICLWDLYTKKVCVAFEIILMTIQGLSGLLIAFMFFFSEHPTVNTNWLLVILNPIPILYLAPRIIKLLKRKYDIYVPIAFVVEALFLILSPFIPQSFSIAIYCFALSLCLHSGTCTYIQHKQKWKRAAY